MNEQQVAQAAARAAAEILIQYSDGPCTVEHKGTVDLVTELDRACEDAIRSVLHQHTPDIPVLGEENGGAEDLGTRWVVDPVDGTTNLVHGFPYYCVSIGLEVDGQPEVGVILDVPRGVVYAGTRGRGSTANDSPIHVSDCRSLDAALLGTGFAYDRRERADTYLRPFRAFLVRARGVRRAGAAALDLAMVASGSLDGFWEFNLKRWDCAAGRLLIEEAGGHFTELDGQPVGPDLIMNPLATNGWLHEQMLAIVEPHR